MTDIINNNYNFDGINDPLETSKNTNTLNQGKNFKKYQKKIIKNVESNLIEDSNLNENSTLTEDSNMKEGFTTEPTRHAKKSKAVLEANKIHESEVSELDSLKKQYESLLKEVQNLQDKTMGNTKTYLAVTNSTNKYHNKNVRFNGNGKTGYVTNRGDFKLYTNNSVFSNTAGKNGCGTTNFLDVNYSGKGYDVPGFTINSNPPLIVGTPMSQGQSCGNEGNNVRVKTILPVSSSVNYSGCYADNSSASSMKFIGGVPAGQTTSSSIVNGNFSQPAIGNNSYTYISNSSKVPGWNFNAFLVNNSKDWGYPVPYPNGNQCACIQQTQNISQTINLEVGEYTLTFFAVGRNCCDGSGKSNPINIQLNEKTFDSVQPPINKWTPYSTIFKVSKNGNNTLNFQGTWNSGDRSTAFQNISISGQSTDAGSYTYSRCKDAAISQGYRYFALQNMNTQTSKGYCVVTNDAVGAKKLGTAYAISGGTALWASNTSGNNGSSATINDQGSLSVVINNRSIFITPNTKGTTSDYLGCYGDRGDRAMPLHNGGSQQYNYAQCKTIAQQTGSAYFGLQNSTSGKNAQCALSNNLNQTTRYGKAGNCTRISDGTYSGGGWSNAVYKSNASGTYFLIVQDDGNVCIYRGSGPNDNQGFIWATNTNGKQQKPNPQFAAAKGKYGTKYMKTGSSLAAGDFIGSTDGSVYLLMQADGNLVLYTSQNVTNCSKMTDGNMGGGAGANALYDLGTTGFPDNLGKIGYVDDDGNLSEYPSNKKLVPPGDTKATIDIDSVQWQNYKNTGKAVSASTFGNSLTLSSAEKKLLDKLTKDLDSLAQTITNKTNKLLTKNGKINDQMALNKVSFKNSTNEFNAITSMDQSVSLNNIREIVNDSDIVVLQENYRYLLWSILAVGVVSLSLNVLNR